MSRMISSSPFTTGNGVVLIFFGEIFCKIIGSLSTKIKGNLCSFSGNFGPETQQLLEYYHAEKINSYTRWNIPSCAYESIETMTNIETQL